MAEVIDRREPSRRLRWHEFPRPGLRAIAGAACLALIAGGAIHLSTEGSALPAQAPTGEGTPVGAASSPAVPRTTGAADRSRPTPGAGTPTTSASSPSVLVVHVAGQVARPGIVRLKPGSRVADAIDAVGGATREADLSAINLARPLQDGEQIRVPRPGEVVADAGPGETSAGAGTPRGGSTPGAGSGKVDLNTASAAQLEELPGVGPSTAARIVEHRESSGPFRSVEDLQEVPGIGPAKLASIKPRATV